MLAGVSTQTHATHKVYSPHVEKGEVEIEARGHVDVDDDGDKDGARKDIFEIGYGVTDWWLTSVFVSGTDNSACCSTGKWRIDEACHSQIGYRASAVGIRVAGTISLIQ